ncbi:MAG: ComF family protein [Alistipes sp.]|nr:ComF family protein [Alistipes sp.]
MANNGISAALADLCGLFFPPVCAACGRGVTREMGFMCAECRLDIPLTEYWKMPDNPVMDRFAGRLPVVQASAFIHYVHGSRYRELVHGFKYSGGWKSARDMGLWYGSCLAESGLYGEVDVVVPVPLHRRKLLGRGYNQAQYIAAGIASTLGVELSTGNLVRSRHGRSQTAVEGHERWENVDGAFKVVKPQAFADRHILLVDDVLTTGATLTACGQAILDSVPDARISIAALAAARHPGGV